MNVLVTSAGRRTSLLKAFAEAVAELEGKVFAADIDGLAPALYFAHKCFRVPPVRDVGYVDALLRIVQEENVSLIVPTIDPELLPLSESAPVFASHGCHVLISLPAFVQMSHDKWLTVQELSHHRFRTPRSWLPDNLVSDEMPEQVFIKPRDGSASQHAYKVHKSHLKHYLAIVPNPIVQECLQLPEFTIDTLVDLNGKPIHYVIRQRIKTVGGESIQGVTVAPEKFHAQIVRLLQLLGEMGARGPITVQAFAKHDELIFSEINPRFGGGFPLSYAAGAKYPQWILQMLKGENPDARMGEYTVNLFMTRFYQEIFLNRTIWEQ
jgi:carbamoyl-phosphate synthase large subunit